jgi:hypothetical protein
MNDEYRTSLLFRTDAGLLSIILFILMLVCIAIGSAWGKKRKAKAEYFENRANDTVHGAVFGLLAFLLAFTFSMSANRYEARRQAVIEEANAIGTAIERADLYPDSDRVVFRNDLKNYLQARIDNITAGADLAKETKADKQASVYESRLWNHASEFSKKNSTVIISGQMMPALNEMFDSNTTDTYNELMRVPETIVMMLFALSLIASLMVGYTSVHKGRFDWFTGTCFCLLSAIVFFITLDLDRPRRGLIQLDTSHHAIISLMDEFKQNDSTGEGSK